MNKKSTQIDWPMTRCFMDAPEICQCSRADRAIRSWMLGESKISMSASQRDFCRDEILSNGGQALKEGTDDQVLARVVIEVLGRPTEGVECFVFDAENLGIDVEYPCEEGKQRSWTDEEIQDALDRSEPIDGVDQ